MRMSSVALAARSRISESRARALRFVGDPFVVERGFTWGESSVDGLAVDLRGPLEVRPVEFRWVCMAAAGLCAATVVAGCDAP